MNNPHIQRWAEIQEHFAERWLLQQRPIHELVLQAWAFGAVLAILYGVWL